MGSTVAVTDQTFEEEVLKSTIPVLVDFWAEWCGPCKMIAPILDKLSTEYEGKLKIAKVDVDSNAEKAGEYGVRGIPTLLIFNPGNPQPADQIVGALPEATLRARIDKVIS
ncbi:MAG: thioredoxin [SAR202 cluster bacterium]|nr:thioredoxin [SAR202 cluster bacterium]|tara:strand:- start:77678 stop:78010 length:333 start_codon:yes stop_codon:yes gene_type:complete